MEITQIIELVFAVIGIVLVAASATIKAFPAVDKNGLIGKIINFIEHFSVFLAKYKNGETETDANPN